MNDIVIRQVDHTAPEYQQVWELREDVLRKPIGLSLKNDDLGWDKQAAIFIAIKEDKVIGCVLLVRVNDQVAKLRAMAVSEQWQGKGIGRMLVAAAEKAATETGYTKLVLHARKVALIFYEKLNYTITSDEFTEVGIPHFAMEKALL